MIVQVTAEDIRDGRRGSCRACPVALALMRTFRTQFVEVWPLTSGGGVLRVEGVGTANASQQVVDFMAMFDAHGWGAPFEFEWKARP